MKWKKDTFFLFGSFVLLWNYSCMVNLLLRESGKIREIKFWVCCVLESAAIERHKEMIFTKFLLFCIVFFFFAYMGTRRQRELDAPSLGPCFIKQRFFFCMIWYWGLWFFILKQRSWILKPWVLCVIFSSQ